MLQQALTHSSYSAVNNERLEYLGDALLSLIIAESLYVKDPDASEGVLTRWRSSLVQQDSLVELAEAWHLEKYILLGKSMLPQQNMIPETVLAAAVEAIIAAIYLDSNFTVTAKIVLRWYDDKIHNLLNHAVVKDPKTTLQEFLQAQHLPLPDYQLLSMTPHYQRANLVRVLCKISIPPYQATGQASTRKRAEQDAAAALLAMMQS